VNEQAWQALVANCLDPSRTFIFLRWGSDRTTMAHLGRYYHPYMDGSRIVQVLVTDNPSEAISVWLSWSGR